MVLAAVNDTEGDEPDRDRHHTTAEHNAGSLLVQASTCNSSANTATVVVYNPGTATTSSSLVVGGGISANSTSLPASTATAVGFASVTGAATGINTAILNTAAGSTTFSLTCVD